MRLRVGVYYSYENVLRLKTVSEVVNGDVGVSCAATFSDLGL